MAELPRWMAIARAMSAKFKAFSFPVSLIKSYSVVPSFRSSVILRFPVSLLRQQVFMPYMTPCGAFDIIYITVKNIDHWIVTLVADKLRRQWSCEVYDSNRGYILCPVKDSSST